MKLNLDPDKPILKLRHTWDNDGPGIRTINTNFSVSGNLPGMTDKQTEVIASALVNQANAKGITGTQTDEVKAERVFQRLEDLQTINEMFAMDSRTKAFLIGIFDVESTREESELREALA